MGQDVFISYKSEEFQEADRVRQQLESGGISCWMAPNSITGGASYATELPVQSDELLSKTMREEISFS